MANAWYYYDEDGVKQGPFTAAELKQHARVGAVRSNTQIETGDGRTSVASKVKGLFPEPPSIFSGDFLPVTVPPPPPIPSTAEPKPVLADDMPLPIDKTMEPESEPLPQKATWCYYDTAGVKQGPITFSKLQILAMHGVIKKDTLLEHEDGDMIPAKNAHGLSFKEEQPVQHERQAPPHNRDVQPVPTTAPQRSMVGDIVMALFIFFFVLPFAIGVIAIFLMTLFTL